MSSQETIEDLTLYQDKLPTSEHQGAAKSTPECKKNAQDDKGDIGRMRSPLRNNSDLPPPYKRERVLLSLNQLDFNLTQLKERAEEIAASISYVAKHLEELKVLVSDLRTDIGNRTDITQRFQQERGILKRAKEERDDEYQFVACTRREKKRARVTWKDQS